MDENAFEELLGRSESDTLDFKSESYKFHGLDPFDVHRKRARFVKDVVSMANTPRLGSAYIIIGVKAKANGERELLGIEEHEDDNTLQQKLDGMVYPFPKFRYIEVSYKGKQYGVIEILDRESMVGPFVILESKSLDKKTLIPKTVYWRRSTMNDEANHDESKLIYHWFSTGEYLQGRTGDQGISAWDRLRNLVDLTSKRQRYILLLAQEDQRPSLDLEHISGVDWNLIVDFDVEASATSSTIKGIESLASARSVHVATKGDQLTGNLQLSTTWYFARGRTGRDITCVSRNWNEWLTVYAQDFKEKFSTIAKSSSEPVVLVALWSDLSLSKHLSRCLDDAVELLGDSVTKVIITDQAESLKAIAESSESEIVELSAGQFFEGLASLDVAKKASGINSILLPGRDGIKKIIPPQDYNWLQEDLELVHLGIGQVELSYDKTAFLKGFPVTWEGLNLRADIDRIKTSMIKKLVLSDLRSRKSSTINIFHYPGAGGSTLARRILWDIHEEFPTIVLNHCKPRETIERIQRIYQATENPILILREGGVISDKDSEGLSDLLASRQIPSVFLQVFRRLNGPPRKAQQVFEVDSQLESMEAGRFNIAFSNVCPDKADELRNLTQSQNPTVLLYGLTAFNENFDGLNSYVARHLESLPESQKKILTYFSLAYVYGQQSLNAQDFSSFLSLPATKIVDLRKALSPAAIGLLVEESAGVWRPMHYQIGKEVLVQNLTKNGADSRTWKGGLVDISCEFVEFCRSLNNTATDKLSEVVTRTFFYRNASDLLGTVSSGERYFSQLVMDIPTPEGRLRLLNHIVGLFPNEPHYWAHLGRLYSLQLQRFDEARDSLETAINLEPGDSVLHHMKGMVDRSEAYYKIENSFDLDLVLDSAAAASLSFDHSRDLSADDEHKYISEVQLIIKVLEYAAKAKKLSPVDASSKSQNKWLKEAFERAETFLSTVRRMNTRSNSSDYEEVCRAELDRLYGSHEIALQRWQSLLDNPERSGIYAPPIRRQIVWTYLARRGRKWENLSNKEIERCVTLLDENLSEEPGNDANVRLWIQASRFLNAPPSVDSAIEKVAYWKSIQSSSDAPYYLSVLYAIQALDGSILAFEKYQKELEECRNISRLRRSRKLSFEWLSSGVGLKRITHTDQLGEWDRKIDFWSDAMDLERVEGSVLSITGPQAGEIELAGGIRAFFVPGPLGLDRGRSENVRVSCYLGFSYDGPRAWAVKVL
jgi:tetratricopeptide (TPR) repeat protein